MIYLMEVLKSMFITYLRADEGRRSHLSEGLQLLREPGSGFWWMCIHQCCSHERAGRGMGWWPWQTMGLQRGRRWPIVRYFTVSWGLGELFHVLCFILIVASWKSGFISNKTSPWSTLSLAEDLYVSFILRRKEEKTRISAVFNTVPHGLVCELHVEGAGIGDGELVCLLSWSV